LGEATFLAILMMGRGDRFWKEQFFGMEVIKLKLIRINISTMTNLMNRNKVIIKRIYHPVIANSKFKQTALN
jgi:hypothetical protein